MEKSERLEVRLDPELHANLAVAANRQRISRAAVVRRALALYCLTSEELDPGLRDTLSIVNKRA